MFGIPFRLSGHVNSLGAGEDESLDTQQFFKIELEANPKHQEDNADGGQLVSPFPLGCRVRGKGGDDDARQEVTSNGRQPQSLHDITENEGNGQPECQRQNEIHASHLLEILPFRFIGENPPVVIATFQFRGGGLIGDDRAAGVQLEG